MKKYLAFDVGCIECQEDSAVIGVFNTDEEATLACKKAKEEQEKNWKGQHDFRTFKITIPE